MTAKRHSVLIVEDEAIVAEDLRQTLTELDYDAFAVASSADEAVTRASERCPDIVLMDIRIKGARDGIDAAAMLRERFDVPIIFLTAHGDRATFERANKTRPFAYLLKPIKTAELRSALEIALLRHQSERELRLRERWFSTTLRSIADAVVAVDRTGKVVFMNSSAEELTGMSEAASVGRPAREVVRLLDHRSQELSETPLDRALSTRTAQELPEGELCGANLVRRTINDSTSPVIDEGELLGAVMVFRDVTERKQLQQQLELADRLASIGTLAAGVAHEVNNPLTVVLGGAELVHAELQRILEDAERQNPLDPILIARVRDAIQAQSEVAVSAQRIANIVADLSGFARPTARTGNHAQVQRSLAWAVRTTSHELNQRAGVITDIADVPAVAIDETRLGQVFVKLLVNAAQAIVPGDPKRNTVTVSARLAASGREVVVEVRDTGCGMPASVRERVFEPFFTTKPVGEGTGLGLSVCHGIVRSAGGTLEVDSKIGEGTVFRLSLPVAEPSSPSASSNAVAPSRRGRVLAIDDEQLVLQTISRSLSPQHEVTCVTNAHDALQCIERGVSFDVILLDLSMPGMSGMEFYQLLQQSKPETCPRVVFLSGGATTPRVADFLAATPNARLDKPFSVVALRALVQSTLAPAGSAA